MPPLLPSISFSTPPRRWPAAFAAGVAVVALVAGMGNAEAQEQAPRTLTEAKDALADAETRLDRLTDQKARAEAAVVELGAERERLALQVEQLDQESIEHHEELQQARRDARLATVEAYVSGNRAEAAVDVERSVDALWQETILSDRADAGVEAAIRYAELEARAEDAVVALAEDADRLSTRIKQAETDIERATSEIAATRQEIVDLRQEIRVLEIVARFGSGRADPGPGAWAALRNCEAGGNYGANTGNGFYGAYQFDLQTWRSVGGSGLPSDAPPWEQDARAKALYQTRGSQPWPVCGRFL